MHNNSKHTNDPLLSIGDASEYLGVSIDTLRRWEKKGKVEAYRSPGNHRYFKKSDLDNLFGKKYERRKETKSRVTETKQKRFTPNNEANNYQPFNGNEILDINLTTIPHPDRIIKREPKPVPIPPPIPIKVITENKMSFREIDQESNNIGKVNQTQEIESIAIIEEGLIEKAPVDSNNDNQSILTPSYSEDVPEPKYTKAIEETQEIKRKHVNESIIEKSDINKPIDFENQKVSDNTRLMIFFTVALVILAAIFTYTMLTPPDILSPRP
jgi:excisionase family DNA binding protein